MPEKGAWRTPAAVLGILSLFCTAIGLYINNRPKEAKPFSVVVVGPETIDPSVQKRIQETKDEIADITQAIEKREVQKRDAIAEGSPLFTIPIGEFSRLHKDSLRVLLKKKERYEADMRAIEYFLNKEKEIKTNLQTKLDSLLKAK